MRWNKQLGIENENENRNLNRRDRFRFYRLTWVKINRIPEMCMFCMWFCFYFHFYWNRRRILQAELSSVLPTGLSLSFSEKHIYCAIGTFPIEYLNENPIWVVVLCGCVCVRVMWFVNEQWTMNMFHTKINVYRDYIDNTTK